MGYNWGSRAASIEARPNPRKIGRFPTVWTRSSAPVQPSDRTNELAPVRPEKRPVLFQLRPWADPPGGRRWIRHCDLAARRARSDAICVCPLESRGRRESRVPMTPAVVRTRCTRRTAGAPEHPAFPAQWFIGLWRALPGDEFLLPPSLTDWRLIEGPVGPDNLHQLDTSNGCQDHTLLPSAASSRHTLRPARMLPEEVSTEAFKRRSSAQVARSRKNRPANISRA
jgi:hypothetical protein